LAREHPEWVLAPNPGSSGLLGRNPGDLGLLNLGLPAAREHITKYWIEVVQQYRLDWLRFEFNVG
jgi:uncharacterized lipoprotein YddW (UPF0748 family)